MGARHCRRAPPRCAGNRPAIRLAAAGAAGACSGAAAAAPAVRRLARRAANRSRSPRHQARGPRSGADGHRARCADSRARPHAGGIHLQSRRLPAPPAAAAHGAHRPRHVPPAPRAGRARRQGVRRRSAPVDRRLGPRIRVRPFRRRASDHADAGDAGLRSAPRRDVPQRAVQRARDRQPRRHRARTPQGFVGGRPWSAAVHALELPPLRAGLRRRRPPRHLVVAARRLRLDCLLPPAARLAEGADVGPRDHRAARGRESSGRGSSPVGGLPRPPGDDGRAAALRVAQARVAHDLASALARGAHDHGLADPRRLARVPRLRQLRGAARLQLRPLVRAQRRPARRPALRGAEQPTSILAFLPRPSEETPRIDADPAPVDDVRGCGHPARLSARFRATARFQRSSGQGRLSL